jgi:hypothetical protein
MRRHEYEGVDPRPRCRTSRWCRVMMPMYGVMNLCYCLLDDGIDTFEVQLVVLDDLRR